MGVTPSKVDDGPSAASNTPKDKAEPTTADEPAAAESSAPVDPEWEAKTKLMQEWAPTFQKFITDSKEKITPLLTGEPPITFENVEEYVSGDIEKPITKFFIADISDIYLKEMKEILDKLKQGDTEGATTEKKVGGGEPTEAEKAAEKATPETAATTSEAAATKSETAAASGNPEAAAAGDDETKLLTKLVERVKTAMEDVKLVEIEEELLTNEKVIKELKQGGGGYDSDSNSSIGGYGTDSSDDGGGLSGGLGFAEQMAFNVAKTAAKQNPAFKPLFAVATDKEIDSVIEMLIKTPPDMPGALKKSALIVAKDAAKKNPEFKKLFEIAGKNEKEINSVIELLAKTPPDLPAALKKAALIVGKPLLVEASKKNPELKKLLALGAEYEKDIDSVIELFPKDPKAAIKKAALIVGKPLLIEASKKNPQLKQLLDLGAEHEKDINNVIELFPKDQKAALEMVAKLLLIEAGKQNKDVAIALKIIGDNEKQLNELIVLFKKDPEAAIKKAAEMVAAEALKNPDVVAAFTAAVKAEASAPPAKETVAEETTVGEGATATTGEGEGATTATTGEGAEEKGAEEKGAEETKVEETKVEETKTEGAEGATPAETAKKTEEAVAKLKSPGNEVDFVEKNKELLKGLAGPDGNFDPEKLTEEMVTKIVDAFKNPASEAAGEAVTEDKPASEAAGEAAGEAVTEDKPASEADTASAAASEADNPASAAASEADNPADKAAVKPADKADTPPPAQTGGGGHKKPHKKHKNKKPQHINIRINVGNHNIIDEDTNSSSSSSSNNSSSSDTSSSDEDEKKQKYVVKRKKQKHK